MIRQLFAKAREHLWPAYDDRRERQRLLHMIVRAIRHNRVRGDYAEFGVAAGATFVDAWRAARVVGISDGMKFWAFDSFRGLPAITGPDVGGGFTEGQYAVTRARFEHRVKRAGVDISRLRVVEGFYSESLRSPDAAELRAISLAWVDCDLYESTVPVLEYLAPRLSDGAVVVFDDWFCFGGHPDKGEERACREWMAGHPELVLVPYRTFRWSGQSFMVHRPTHKPAPR